MRHFLTPHRLDFGSGGKGDMLFAGGLIAIIALALFLSIYTFVSDDGPVGESSNPHYKCMVCDAEFEMTLEELSAQMSETGMAMEADPAEIPVRCKECGKDFAALPMQQCPACEKWYVTDMTKAQAAGQSIEPFLSSDYKQTCPHCGKAHLDALKEKYKK